MKSIRFLKNVRPRVISLDKAEGNAHHRKYAHSNINANDPDLEKNKIINLPINRLKLLRFWTFCLFVCFLLILLLFS